MSTETQIAKPAPRPFPARTGFAEVLRREQVTPHMARITFGGDALAELPVETPGEIITLGFAPVGEELTLPRGGWRFPGGIEQHWRNYTVRGYDPVSGELAIDFALHSEPVGIATHWAIHAAPGDRVGFAGPRIHWEPEPRQADEWELFAGDETALPAISAILESLPPGARAIAFVEVADAGERQRLDLRADVDLRWLYRGGAPAGTSTVLIDAIRAAELPERTARSWGAGEAGVMRQLREHLRDERGLPRQRVKVGGYWKHRRTPDWGLED